MLDFFNQVPTSLVIALAAGLATVGWMFTCRTSRIIARKQHTFNVLSGANFQEAYRKAFAKVVPYLDPSSTLPKLSKEKHADLRAALRLILNYFEFISAGIRRGDLDERLVYDTYRGTIGTLFENLEDYIYGVRINRKRSAIYEHMEWLYMRWEGKPPKRMQRTIEVIRAAPLYGDRVRIRD